MLNWPESAGDDDTPLFTAANILAWRVRQRCVAIGLAGSLPPARSVAAYPALVYQIGAALSARGISYSIGSIWTTDAPYRETRCAVATCHAEGVKTVEMETAALIAVGERLIVPTAAVFVIGDRLIDPAWQPAEDTRLLHRRVTMIAEALLEALSAE